MSDNKGLYIVGLNALLLDQRLYQNYFILILEQVLRQCGRREEQIFESILVCIVKIKINTTCTATVLIVGILLFPR